MEFSVNFFCTNGTVLFHTKDMVQIEQYHLVLSFGDEDVADIILFAAASTFEI